MIPSVKQLRGRDHPAAPPYNRKGLFPGGRQEIQSPAQPLPSGGGYTPAPVKGLRVEISPAVLAGEIRPAP